MKGIDDGCVRGNMPGITGSSMANWTRAAELFEKQEVRCDTIGSEIMELKSSPNDMVGQLGWTVTYRIMEICMCNV
jgi:hypothetical protein